MFFDAHADIWTDFIQKHEQGETHIFNRFHRERFAQGRVNQGVFTIWVDPPHDATPEQRTLDMIRVLFAELRLAEDSLCLVRQPGDFQRAEAEGKFAALIGMEGLAALGTQVEWLYALHELGVRTASLTWNEQNALATGAKGDPNRGLTAEGVRAIEIMETLNMVVDVSHANDKTFWDIAGKVTKPFIASHSNARALCDVPRNLSDDQIRAIADSGGVVGMNAYKAFVDQNPEQRHVERLGDHICHIVNLVGIDHVGFGFDFFDFLKDDALGSFTEDAEENGIAGLRDSAEVPNLLPVLQKRGFTEQEILKIARGNFRRIYENALAASVK